MTRDEARDLIGAYVLGACTPEEAAQVRAHLEASPELRAEVASYDGVREALLDVPVAKVAPDAALRSRLMAQVREEASLFAAAGPTERTAQRGAEDAATSPGTPTGAAGTETADAAVGATGATGATDATGATEPSSGPEGASAHGATAATAGTVEATGAQERVDAPRATGGRPDAAGPRRGGFLAALRHPARATALAAVLVALVVGGFVVGSGGGGDGGREIPGQATPIAGAGATVRLVAQDGESRLRLRGFRPAGPGKEYQVWLKTGNAAPRPTTVLFDVDAQGNAEATIPGDLDAVDDVLVTAEPRGGSPAPTSDPVLQVRV